MCVATLFDNTASRKLNVFADQSSIQYMFLMLKLKLLSVFLGSTFHIVKDKLSSTIALTIRIRNLCNFDKQILTGMKS